ALQSPSDIPQAYAIVIKQNPRCFAKPPSHLPFSSRSSAPVPECLPPGMEPSAFSFTHLDFVGAHPTKMSRGCRHLVA
ncbi:hypothetical protein Ancab_007355, partial [Ancistrocladus abbreviatus]